MIRRRSHRKRRATRAPITVESKWGWEPCIEVGWCAVPAALLRHAAGLGITPEEGWLLIQLLDLKWNEGRSTLDNLTERCQLDQETICRLMRSLEARGLLKLIPKSAKGAVVNGRKEDSGEYSRLLAGWELDLSYLLRALNDYIMRDGDLSSGFLRLSSVRLDKDANAAG